MITISSNLWDLANRILNLEMKKGEFEPQEYLQNLRLTQRPEEAPERTLNSIVIASGVGSNKKNFLRLAESRAEKRVEILTKLACPVEEVYTKLKEAISSLSCLFENWKDQTETSLAKLTGDLKEAIKHCITWDVKLILPDSETLPRVFKRLFNKNHFIGDPGFVPKDKFQQALNSMGQVRVAYEKQHLWNMSKSGIQDFIDGVVDAAEINSRLHACINQLAQTSTSSVKSINQKHLASDFHILVN